MLNICYFSQILVKREFSRYTFEECSYTKFHINSSSGSRVVPYGRRDMMNLVVGVRNFS
jgi:hypothetical protein